MQTAITNKSSAQIRKKIIISRCNAQWDRGFTLLEIMVAIAIIAIVLVSVYRMHAQTISMNYRSRFYAVAPLLAQGKMAEMETKLLDELADETGDFGEDYIGFHWKVVVGDVESEALGQTADDLKRIDVMVWLNNEELTYSLRAYRFY